MTPAENGSHIVQTLAKAPAEGHRRNGRWPGRTPVAAVRDWAGRHPVPGQLCLLLTYVGFGVLATWPRATYLVSRLPNSRDEGIYTWEMWWVAHQVAHFGGLFTTHQIFAPVGAQLAYHDLMPLVCLIMMPVTVTAGPAVSVNLLSVLVPGLLAYSMYCAARLWLTPTGAFASGLFFGLSSMLAWRAWFHLNIAVGAVFLPLTLAAAVRLRRDPSVRRALVLGLVLGLSLLVDLESAVLALLTATAVLVGWLFSDLRSTSDHGGIRRHLGLVGIAAGVCLAVGSPQLVAMVRQAAALAPNPAELAVNYVSYGVALPQLFTPSPHVAAFGLTRLSTLFHDGITTEGMPTFGVTLTVLALLGVVIGRGRRQAWIWLGLWLGIAVLALGPVLYLGTRAVTPLPIQDHGQTLSLLMPFTWFVHLPGMASFREANRFTVLALMPAALLAGSAVAWIGQRFAPALVLVALVCVPELGWSSVAQYGTMPTGLPAADRAIAADSSSSLVVDVPLGFRSGTLELGPGFPAEELVEATLDGHPRAIGYVARLPQNTAVALAQHAFYADLRNAQAGHENRAASVPAAIADARQLNVGWVLVWTPVTPRIGDFLTATGFSLDYRTDGVSVYRAVGR